MAVPLSVKGDVLGVMLLEEAMAPHRSLERWTEIVSGIAHQTALAIQSDRLQQEMAGRERLERELQLAREIQQTLMPRQLPDLLGWELAVLCLPARQVGGDFYDFFELPDGRLGLVIADVADKGMPAALFMALTRTLVRAAALEEPSPAAALARTNNLLVPDAEQGMFVTAIYAVLSIETGELVYANAGHNPPLLSRAETGQLEPLAKGGMALGVLADSEADDHRSILEPGDSLVFYTDGITEAFSPEGDIFGEELLQTAIKDTDGLSAQATLDRIHESVLSFSGGTSQSDDLTLMVVRRSR
jgi:serine phosphatase RsbU (regulator of sigma subunit)